MSSGIILCALGALATAGSQIRSEVAVNPQREAYYGDLHLHTTYSFSVSIFSPGGLGPDDAYRFARGEAVNYLGRQVRRREPLDFLAVTDHSGNLGVFAELEDPSSAVSRSAVGQSLESIRTITRKLGREGLTSEDWQTTYKLWADLSVGRKNELPENLKPSAVAAWERYIDSANRNYKPGKFTTFIGFEWAATPLRASLHRNVIFEGNVAPYPYTVFDSNMPEGLWDWLDTIRKEGFDAIAIPHNSNESSGLMYDSVESGVPFPLTRQDAEQRQRNEPVSEISQNKGASETHPVLSPEDEFADFEIMDNFSRSGHQVGQLQGSYLRDALSRGLILQRQLGINPFKYGFVGGSDLHAGLSVSAQEDYGGNDYAGNFGAGKLTKSQAIAVLNEPRGGTARRFTSGNLTGVWAESNTRESIFSALRRREVFATSGTRLKFRFFGGWGFSREMLQQRDWVVRAYASGVPMGGDLPANTDKGRAPTFAVWAEKDPNGANLDRIQVVKVWDDDGVQKEKVFDVAWAGPRVVNPMTGTVSAVGDTVDVKTGTYTDAIGAAELEAVWTDPEFVHERLAAYYLRVLEIPTPRWSTLLALKYGLPLPKDVPATEQQRGWSSPIWYSPPAN